jgi:hypothetical protein
MSDDIFEIGEKVLGLWAENQFVECEILEERVTALSELEYYIHFTSHDRRMDRWFNTFFNLFCFVLIFISVLLFLILV